VEVTPNIPGESSSLSGSFKFYIYDCYRCGFVKNAAEKAENKRKRKPF
jgi:hypothetical protein